jgi:hypothetical protein
VDWGSFWEHVLSGAVLALVAAVLATFVTNRLTAERARENARRDRDLATARDLYTVAGELFAAWKLWDFHSREPGPDDAPYGDDRRSAIVQLAASAEGQCESLLVRIAQEHDLDPDDIAALWCLRSAFKQLRYQIRENKQLRWWATDSHGDDGNRHYTAYKNVLALVGTIVENQTGAKPWYRVLFERNRQGPPSKAQQRIKMVQVKSITRHDPPEPVAGGEAWVVLAERLTLPWSEAEEVAPTLPSARPEEQ